MNRPSILRTRIIPPKRRGDVLSRPRLLALINSLVEKRLMLISAPAGYGKTSLMVDFVNSSELPVCWYAIDKLDFDPNRFIAYLVAAIQLKFPGFGGSTLAALQGETRPFDGDHFATIFINDLLENVTEHFLIVLDDYHLITDSLQIRNFITRLLLDAAENLHVAILSRSLLSLPAIPILTIRSDVGGISYEELEFTAEEIKKLYQENLKQTLSLESSEELRKSTEGWITGIVLASQFNSSQRDSRSRLMRVSGDGLESFFLHVIDQLPHDLRQCLLLTSLLEEFNSERCEKIIGSALALENPDWNGWLEQIQHNNLFVIPVGDDGEWLRYHPLFMDFLQTQVNKEYPTETRAIEMALAKSWMDAREYDRAFAIFRQLNATDEVVELIELSGPSLASDGRIATLSAWLDSVPGFVINTRPFIISLQGYVALAVGDTNLALSLFNQAANAMVLPGDTDKLAKTLSMRATVKRLRGDLAGAVADANESSLLVENELTLRKIHGDNLRCIGLCKYHQGLLDEAMHWLNEALAVMQAIEDEKGMAVVQLELGLVYENRGNYAASRERYHLALAYWQKVQNPIWMSNILNNLGVLQQMMGDYIKASQSFEEALAHARASNYSRMEAFVLAGIGDIYTEVQALDQAAIAYKQAAEIAEKIDEHFLQVYIATQAAALAVQQNNMREAELLLKRARKKAHNSGSELERHIVDLETAGLHIMNGEEDAAIALLNSCHDYFSEQGHKIQLERCHLYEALAYQGLQQPENAIQPLLYTISCIEGEYPSAPTLALATRFEARLRAMTADFITEEIDLLWREISRFKEKLPVFWRHLRETARAIPFAPATIYIRALGRVQVQINKSIISSSDWQTQYARDLLFMLLAHTEGLTREEICLNFWPDASPEDARFRFKNTIYRLRRALGKDAVLLEQELYRFNNKMDYEYDVEMFLRSLGLANQSRDEMQKLSHLREAIRNYRGSYLSDLDYEWVASPRVILRQNYLAALMQVSEIYLGQSNHDLAMEYCQRAIVEDNLLEDAYRLAFRIFSAIGNRAGMVKQYQQMVELLQNEIGIEPSQQTKRLYNQLLSE